MWEVPGNAGYVIGPKPDGCALFVPFRCSEAYKASEKWSQFKIEEMPEDEWYYKLFMLIPLCRGIKIIGRVKFRLYSLKMIST